MPRPLLTRRNCLVCAAGGLAALAHPWLLLSAPPALAEDAMKEGDLFCTELYLPANKRAEAAKLAVAENPQNVAVETPKEMGTVAAPFATAGQENQTLVGKFGALLRANKWANGRTLKVHFMGGNAAMHMKVQQFADLWSEFANVKFQFGMPAQQSDVRIAFGNTGHWSYMGTDVLSIPKTQPTMNLQLTAGSANTEWSRVVIHEFGHTLGLIHEHQHPDGGIPWDRDKVYAYYLATQGWNKEMVDNNLFATYDRSWLQYGMYDRKSIMHYPIPASLLTNPNRAVGWNTELSTLDKLFIKTAYPKPA